MQQTPILTAIKLIENIGRFSTAKPLPGVRLAKCTLVFGENGWGKSTLADILRSPTTRNPDIIRGRATLGGGSAQNAVFMFGTSAAIFQRGAWTGYHAKIAVYDSTFTNDNIFSGDQVSPDHLRNQYGPVVGEDGVRRVRRLVELDDENRARNNEMKAVEAEITRIMQGVAPAALQLQSFLRLANDPAIDHLIDAKLDELGRAQRARELKAAGLPETLPVPRELDVFRRLLMQGLDDIGDAAIVAVRRHIALHHFSGGDGGLSHESWLEAGIAFADGARCPFCGQELIERTLVSAYKAFFGEAYRALAEETRKARETCRRYMNGDFRAAVMKQDARNREISAYWLESANVSAHAYADLEHVIVALEANACALDVLMARKLESAGVDGQFTSQRRP